MFLIFGDKHRTEPVKGGLQTQRECPKCAELAVFRERVVSKQFRLYFVEMFTHGTHHVMECSACGTTFVTDELQRRSSVNDHSGTVFGAVQEAVARGKRAAQEGSVGRALEQASAEVTRVAEQAEEEVGKALNAAQERVDGLLQGLRRDKR